jgi:hypothetical protein
VAGTATDSAAPISRRIRIKADSVVTMPVAAAAPHHSRKQTE